MSFITDAVGLTGNNQAGGARAQFAPMERAVTLDQAAYNQGLAQMGLGKQLQFLDAIQAQNGLVHQNQVFNQQQALASQLQNVANGTGPNPALQQLQNTTGQNVANQAALMAGQRGSGANAGLLARQIAQQGANTQQQAVGQGAALGAQQQLAGMNALQQQQNMMGNLATGQVGQQNEALGNYSKSASNEYATLLNAINAQNQNAINMQSNVNSSNAGVASANIGQQGNMMGTLGGIGAAAMLLNKGGMIPHYADGGTVSGPMSAAAKFLKVQSLVPSGMNDPFKNAFQQVSSIASLNAAGGALIPGKAAVKGDSLKNDKVPAILSPKEIVLPRSVTMAKDAPEKAKQFVAAILAKNGMKRG